MADEVVRGEVRREARQQSSSFEWRNHVHTDYFRTKEGLLKIVEFFLVLLALILASAEAGGTTGTSSIQFFIFMTTSAFISSLCHILLIIVGVYQRLPGIVVSNIVQLVIYAVASGVFLISSIVMLAKWGRNGVIATAAVIGLICSGLFFIEFAIWFSRYRTSGPFQRSEASGDGKQTERAPDDFADPHQQGY